MSLIRAVIIDFGKACDTSKGKVYKLSQSRVISMINTKSSLKKDELSQKCMQYHMHLRPDKNHPYNEPQCNNKY